MINLLPLQEKEKILLDRKKRLIIVLSFFAVFFISCLILTLLSVKFYIQGQVEYGKIMIEEMKRRLDQPEYQNIQEKIDEINFTLTQLVDFYRKETCFVGILEKISTTVPKEVYLTSLSTGFYSVGEDCGLKFSLSGFTPTREILFNFKKDLERESRFKEVYFPPINWVKPADIDFSVTFKVSSRLNSKK